MIYYFLLAGLVSLVSVYFNHIRGGKLHPIPNSWAQDFLPTVISVLILAVYLGNSEKPIDIRKNDYTAIGMKHYDEWDDLGISTTHHEFFSGVYKDRDGVYREFEIPKSTYEYFKNLWEGKQELKISTDSFRDIYFLEWNKKPENALIYTRPEVFNNYFKNSYDLYNFLDISDQTAKKEGLYTRGRVDLVNKDNILEPRQSLVYGLEISDSLDRVISRISSIDSDFRPILLVWVDSLGILDKEKIINHQKYYWAGGKNNEVTFCVAINNVVEKKILWSGSFSWAISHELEKHVIAKSLMPGDTLNSKKYTSALISGYSKNYWHPRKFEMYSVLSIPIMDFTIILSSIMIIIVNLALIARLMAIEEKKKEERI